MNGFMQFVLQVRTSIDFHITCKWKHIHNWEIRGTTSLDLRGFLSGAFWKGFCPLAILCLHGFHKLGSVPLHRNWFTNQKRWNTGDEAHTCKSAFLGSSVYMKCSWNSVWMHMELSLRMVSRWFSSWPDTPHCHPVLVLPGRVSLFHLTSFLIYRVSLLRTGLTWDHASRWLRPINYLAKCNRVVAKVFPFNSCHSLNLGGLSWIIYECPLLPLAAHLWSYFSFGRCWFSVSTCK